MLFPGRRTPIATLLESNKGPLWLVVSFPVDLETPIQKLKLGLLIVLLEQLQQRCWSPDGLFDRCNQQR